MEAVNKLVAYALATKLIEKEDIIYSVNSLLIALGLDAVAALKAGDLEQFGKLMNASHVSLRDDYDVTGVELDTLAEEAWKIPGVIGSRMTGGGFGGCTVSIVKDEAVENFKKTVGENYKKKIGYDATFYTVEIGGGPEVI